MENKTIKDFEKLMTILLLVIILLYILFSGIIGFTSIPNEDMSPRLDGGDISFFYRLDKTPDTNEIISYNENGLEHFGRVIGRPGDIINITEDHGLEVNNYYIIENKIYESTKPYGNSIKYPLILKEDEYFVLADKRSTGEDSRIFGPIKQSEINGVLLFVIRKVNL